MNTLVRPMGPAFDRPSCNPGAKMVLVAWTAGWMECSVTMYRVPGKHPLSLNVTVIVEVSGASMICPP